MAYTGISSYRIQQELLIQLNLMIKLFFYRALHYHIHLPIDFWDKCLAQYPRQNGAEHHVQRSQ